MAKLVGIVVVALVIGGVTMFATYPYVAPYLQTVHQQGLNYIAQLPAKHPTCDDQFTLQRGEATEPKKVERIIGYHTECTEGYSPQISGDSFTGGEVCGGYGRVPDYVDEVKEMGTGIQGRLKILNKSDQAVTLLDISINGRESAACHAKGMKTLEQGDFIEQNSPSCGDIVSVKIRTTNGSCDFHF